MLKLYTANSAEAARCVTQLQNAALSPGFTVVTKPDSPEMLWNTDSISTWAVEAFQNGKHFYGGNQTGSYTVSAAAYPIANKVSIEFGINYMADAKAINDLRCACGTIAQKLSNQLRSSVTFAEKLSAVQMYLSRQFQYRDSGQSEAHCAVDLMRSGFGVCQAIASMATILLPYMGVPCLYISGEGYSGTQWGPHGWNAVKKPDGQWIFVDFTFGLRTVFFPPSTINNLTKRLFEANHRWDAQDHSPEALERDWQQLQRISKTKLTIAPNKQMFFMDGIRVAADRKVLQKGVGGYEIDLVFLFRLLGGGVEYMPEQDRLHVVLLGHQAYVERASAYIQKNGLFSVGILNALPVSYTCNDYGIVLQLNR